MPGIENKYSSQDLKNKLGIKSDRSEQKTADEEVKPRFFVDSALREKAEKGDDASFSNGALSIVCDGVGGVKGGAEASRLAVAEIKRCLGESAQSEPRILSQEMAEVLMDSAIDSANTAILKKQKKDKELAHMATTVSATLLFKDKQTGDLKMAIGQVGDSRVYLLRDNKLEHISPEDSYVNHLNTLGLDIDDQDDSVLDLTVAEYLKKKKIKPGEAAEKELYRLSPWSKLIKDCTIGQCANLVTRTLGAEVEERHITTVNVQDGDLVMLSSDGLHDNRNNANLEKLLLANKGKSPEEIAQIMVEYGYEGQTDQENPRRNKSDDISVIIQKINKSKAMAGSDANQQAVA